MAHTNSTDNYGLPQWIGTDKPTFLGDFNSAFSTIDTAMKNNADAATTAVNTANTASTAAATASTNATTALNTADSAASDAASAVTTAGAADTKATQALAAASTAETAAAANTITNLAPAYDSTLTYAVGDLVTYVDAQGSGKLYKCIVAIGTPEEFNINKWDDVTTSEVYSTKSRLVKTVTGDGTMTFKDAYDTLASDGFNQGKEYLVTSYNPTSGVTMISHERYQRNTEIGFFNVAILSASSAEITEFVLSTEGNSGGSRFTLPAGTGTPYSTDVVPTGSVLSLYELLTI